MLKTVLRRILQMQARVQVDGAPPISKTQLVEKMLAYVQQNYRTDNVILIFNYLVSPEMIELTKRAGFQKSLRLVQGEKPWRIGVRDGHWSIYGHNQAALQVKQYLETLLKNHD